MDISNLELYLLIGQSNMAGRGELPLGKQLPDKRVYMLNMHNIWVPATDPLHYDIPERGVGPGLSFGRTIANIKKKAKIGLIPCAVGGTKLDCWAKGGDLFEHAVYRTKLAMKTGCLEGILWHQGESDCNLEEDAISYGYRLQMMIKDLRYALGSQSIPFIAGKLGEFLDRIELPFVEIVNNALVRISERVSDYNCVDSVGLDHINDYLHFNAESAVKLGKRYAKAMVALQKKYRLTFIKE